MSASTKSLFIACSVCIAQTVLLTPALAQAADAAAGASAQADAAKTQEQQPPAQKEADQSASHKKQELSDYQLRHKDEGYYDKGHKKKRDDMSDYQRRHEDEGYYSTIKPYAPPPPEAAPTPPPLSQPISVGPPPLVVPAVNSRPDHNDDTGTTGSITATRHAKSAAEDFKAGRYPSAVGHFRASLDAFPNQPELYPDYIESLRKINGWVEMQTALEKWFAIQPEKRKYYEWMEGEAYLNVRNTAKAGEVLNQCLKYGSHAEDIHKLLLRIAIEKKDQAEMSREYAALVKIKPNDYQTQLDYANMLEVEGKHGDALSHYKTAFGLQPTDGKLASRVAYMLMYYNKDYNGAINYYHKAINADPANASKYEENIRYAESMMPKAQPKKVQQ